MAYSDYGAFVYKNGERRTDKEDVGVFDTDEGADPSGARIWLNIIKNRKENLDGSVPWWKHSQHGVIGDGNIRVACYKQGVPVVWILDEGSEEPRFLSQKDMIDLAGITKDYYSRYDIEDYGANGKEILAFGYEYDAFGFDFEGHHITIGHDNHYYVLVTEPNGTEWKCEYDYEFGAGISDSW